MEANVLQFMPTRATLIRHRLKVEAVLLHMGLPVRVLEGCLFIGKMPISIVGMAGGTVRLEITAQIQTSPVESMGLSQVLEDINRSDDGILVDAPEEFSVRFRWVYEFSGEIESGPLVAGIGALSRTYELLNGSGKQATHFDSDLNLPKLND